MLSGEAGESESAGLRLQRELAAVRTLVDHTRLSVFGVEVAPLSASIECLVRAGVSQVAVLAASAISVSSASWLSSHQAPRRSSFSQVALGTWRSSRAILRSSASRMPLHANSPARWPSFVSTHVASSLVDVHCFSHGTLGALRCVSSGCHHTHIKAASPGTNPYAHCTTVSTIHEP